ncbi:MAG: Uma2 family endonuclease [Deltaproteobacteria bacterium]|nr:Uma2 family endonuclease [Deltaproteobacteria bacterium]
MGLPASAFSRTEDRSEDDQIVVLSGLTWDDYRRILEARGDRPVPRMAFLEGDLELMSPSRHHESLKGRIGCLVEAYCFFAGIEFDTVGSWTLEDRKVARAIEPDECYIFRGEATERPHLAIEVVWTSGGLRKLDIYRKLGVREVWYWRLGRLTIHVLEGESYVEAEQSEVLPGIDVAELSSFLDRPTASQAVREYSRALGSRQTQS